MTLAWWAITVLSIVSISHTGRELLSRQHAQHAADAVALAWVSRGSNAGQTVANAYDAIVTRAKDEGSRVRVWITRGDHQASATAQYTQ
jgi:murein tripeptide amidase MpaA